MPEQLLAKGILLLWNHYSNTPSFLPISTLNLLMWSGLKKKQNQNQALDPLQIIKSNSHWMCIFEGSTRGKAFRWGSGLFGNNTDINIEFV